MALRLKPYRYSPTSVGSVWLSAISDLFVHLKNDGHNAGFYLYLVPNL